MYVIVVYLTGVLKKLSSVYTVKQSVRSPIYSWHHSFVVVSVVDMVTTLRTFFNQTFVQSFNMMSLVVKKQIITIFLFINSSSITLRSI